MEDPPELDEFTELEDTDDYYSWLGLSSDVCNITYFIYMNK